MRYPAPSRIDGTPAIVPHAAPVSRAQRNAEYNALMDAARARAIALRREAVQAFWVGVGAQADRGLRAFYRYNQRLARHLMHRGERARARQLEA